MRHTANACRTMLARLTNLQIHRVSVTSRTSYLMPSELQPSVCVINLIIFIVYYLKTQVVPQSKRPPPPL